MSCFGFIFARSGSKGIPGKNIKTINGVSLIARAVKHAMMSEEIEKVFVSTDSTEIADIAETAGAEVPFLRPRDLAQDDSPEWLSWQHAASFVSEKYGSFDRFVAVPATAPCREAEDIDRCIAVFDENCDSVITTTSLSFNPYFTMVSKDKQGYVDLFDVSGKKYKRRQDTPPVYGIVPIAYVTSPNFIEKSTGIWDGRVKTLEVDPLTAIDIDHPRDFYLAELILKDRELTKNSKES